MEHRALENHPELAILWSLHYTSRLALVALDAAHPVEPDPEVRKSLVDVRAAIAQLVDAVERYKVVTEQRCPSNRVVALPRNWSREQTAAVSAFLQEIARRIS